MQTMGIKKAMQNSSVGTYDTWKRIKEVFLDENCIYENISKITDTIAHSL